MDKMAIFEIENAIRKAKQRMILKPVVCKNCMNEMEAHYRYIVCWYCRKIHWLKPRYKKNRVRRKRPQYWYKKY